MGGVVGSCRTAGTPPNRSAVVGVWCIRATRGQAAWLAGGCQRRDLGVSTGRSDSPARPTDRGYTPVARPAVGVVATNEHPRWP